MATIHRDVLNSTESLNSEISDVADYSVVTIRNIEETIVDSKVLSTNNEDEDEENKTLIPKESIGNSHRAVTRDGCDTLETIDENKTDDIRKQSKNISLGLLSQNKCYVKRVDKKSRVESAQKYCLCSCGKSILAHDLVDKHCRHKVNPSLRQIDTNVKLKRRRSCTRKSRRFCEWIVIAYCAILSTAVFIYLLYYKTEVSKELTHNLMQTQPTAQAFSQDIHHEIMARFDIDQKAFVKEEATFIPWSPIGKQVGGIKYIANTSCLQVPEAGTYGVFSKFTFTIRNDTDVDKLGHYFDLKGCEDWEKEHQRHTTTLPFKQYRHVEERISSVLQSFIAMKAGGQICISVRAPHLLYTSGLDNTVNIFKL